MPSRSPDPALTRCRPRSPRRRSRCGRRLRQSGADGGASAPEGAVVTSFYPIQFATQQITGGAVPVTVLTKPGAEPHDLELAPQDIARHDQGAPRRLRRRLPAGGRRGRGSSTRPRCSTSPTRLHLTLTLDEDGRARGRDRHSSTTSTATRAATPTSGSTPQRYAAVAKAIGARLVEGRPGQRRDLREEHRDLRREALRARRASAGGPRAVPLQGARHQPRRLRLPRRPLRLRAARHHRRLSRGRAERVRPQGGRRPRAHPTA